MDMHFYWVRDQVEQKHFGVKRKPGHTDLGDHFTNHDTLTHHWSMRKTYPVNAIIEAQKRILQGCTKTRNL